MHYACMPNLMHYACKLTHNNKFGRNNDCDILMTYINYEYLDYFKNKISIKFKHVYSK